MLLLVVFISACGQNSNKSNFEKNYKEYKQKFNEKLTDHFPDVIHSSEHLGFSYQTNYKKNNIGLLLYEYGVDVSIIRSLEKSLKNIAISKSTSLDSCLLIVNRFETIETLNDLEIPKILDSEVIDKNCYKDKYPIPNFVDYEEYNSRRALRLDDGFDLYVLEAKPNMIYGPKDLGPSPQMPEKWKNGYSKGIAINKQKRIIIYWGIVW